MGLSGRSKAEEGAVIGGHKRRVIQELESARKASRIQGMIYGTSAINNGCGAVADVLYAGTEIWRRKIAPVIIGQHIPLVSSPLHIYDYFIHSCSLSKPILAHPFSRA